MRARRARRRPAVNPPVEPPAASISSQVRARRQVPVRGRTLDQRADLGQHPARGARHRLAQQLDLARRRQHQPEHACARWSSCPNRSRRGSRRRRPRARRGRCRRPRAPSRNAWSARVRITDHRPKPNPCAGGSVATAARSVGGVTVPTSSQRAAEAGRRRQLQVQRRRCRRRCRRRPRPCPGTWRSWGTTVPASRAGQRDGDQHRDAAAVDADRRRAAGSCAAAGRPGVARRGVATELVDRRHDVAGAADPGERAAAIGTKAVVDSRRPREVRGRTSSSTTTGVASRPYTATRSGSPFAGQRPHVDVPDRRAAVGDRDPQRRRRRARRCARPAGARRTTAATSLSSRRARLAGHEVVGARQPHPGRRRPSRPLRGARLVVPGPDAAAARGAGRSRRWRSIESTRHCCGPRHQTRSWVVPPSRSFTENAPVLDGQGQPAGRLGVAGVGDAARRDDPGQQGPGASPGCGRPAALPPRRGHRPGRRSRRPRPPSASAAPCFTVRRGAPRVQNV